MGMKDIDSELQIVDFDEALKLDKTKNITLFSKLGNNKVLIKYKGKIPENIKNLYKNTKLNSIEKETKLLNKNQIKELNLIKKKCSFSCSHTLSNYFLFKNFNKRV
jgi:hypothetical protein